MLEKEEYHGNKNCINRNYCGESGIHRGVESSLHEYGKYIIGRMGIPYREREVNIISVAIDAPQDVINALSGKIGRLDGIGAKTVYSNIKGKNEK